MNVLAMLNSPELDFFAQIFDIRVWLKIWFTASNLMIHLECGNKFLIDVELIELFLNSLKSNEFGEF